VLKVRPPGEFIELSCKVDLIVCPVGNEMLFSSCPVEFRQQFCNQAVKPHMMYISHTV
jgi:hypothetical protein